MNSYIIKKLKEGRLNAKLKQSEVAERIGIKGNTLSNYENGVSEPDIDTFCALCDIYNIDPSIILNEAYGLKVQGESFKIKPSEIEYIKKYRFIAKRSPEGAKIVDTILNREHSIAGQLQEKNRRISELEQATMQEHNLNQEMRTINYYYRLASAGTGQIVFDTPPTKRIEIPNAPKYIKVDYAIGVNGNSMEPAFHAGDTLLIEMTEEIKQGEIGIFLVDGESYVKKLGNGELVSLNPEYKNILLTNDSKCMGKVIGKL